MYDPTNDCRRFDPAMHEQRECEESKPPAGTSAAPLQHPAPRGDAELSATLNGKQIVCRVYGKRYDLAQLLYHLLNAMPPA